MKHYKKPDGTVFGFDKTQTHLISSDMREMTEIEFQLYRNPPLTKEQETKELQFLAIQALNISDKTAWRCFKAGIPFPIEWQEWTTLLRNIVNGTNISYKTIPIHPSFPLGT